MFGTYRTLLALMVVALHLGGIHAMASYAVFGFYALSGYLMTLIMQTRYGYTPSGISRYAINRFLRIYPIYWASLALSLGLIFLFGEQYTSNYHSAIYLPDSVGEIVRNLALLFPYREEPRLTPPAWALTVELFYYALIGLGLSRWRWAVVAWFVASLAFHAAVVYLELGYEYQYFSVLGASLPFSTGAMIYHYRLFLQSRLQRIRGRAAEMLPYAVFAALLLNWLARFLSDATTAHGFFYTNLALCALMIVVLRERRSLPLISRAIDKWMGDFSYPIYLIHLQLGLIVITLGGMSGMQLERPSLTLLALSIPCLFLLSWLFTIAIERPIEFLRDHFKR